MPSFETAEAMCEMWGHPQAYEDGGCACGAVPAATTPPEERCAEINRGQFAAQWLNRTEA